MLQTLDLKILGSTKLLKPTEKNLLKTIHSLSKDRGYCYATNQYLADTHGLSKSAISRAINKLVDKGYLKNVIVRDDRKMVIERKLTLTSLVFELFGKVLDVLKKAAENINKSQDKIECNDVVVLEVKEQLGFELSNKQRKEVNEIEDLNILSNKDVKDCVKRTVNGCDSKKQKSRFNFLLRTLKNQVEDNKKPNTKRIIRVEKISSGNYEVNENGILVAKYSSNKNSQKTVSNDINDFAKSLGAPCFVPGTVGGKV